MNKIVSLNFIKTNSDNSIEYLNPNKFPIMFFWNGNDTVIQEMSNNEEFIELIITKYCTTDNYSLTNIYLTDYNIDEDSYEQHQIEIQRFITLAAEELKQLSYKYIEEILLNLYKTSMKDEYKLLVESDIDNIINIYTILKDKYKTRISPETLKNYILSQLQQKYKLTESNCEEIIRLYDEIIS